MSKCIRPDIQVECLFVGDGGRAYGLVAGAGGALGPCSSVGWPPAMEVGPQYNDFDEDVGKIDMKCLWARAVHVAFATLHGKSYWSHLKHRGLNELHWSQEHFSLNLLFVRGVS